MLTSDFKQLIFIGIDENVTRVLFASKPISFKEKNLPFESNFARQSTFSKKSCPAKKRGIKRGTNRFSATSCRLADVFEVHVKGYSRALISKNRLQRLGPKKGRDFIMWSALSKTQRRVVTLQKYSFFCFHTPPCGTQSQRYSTCCYSYGGGSGSIFTWAVGCSSMSHRTSEFLVAHSTSKRLHLFQALKVV